jgi:hypothetical protein
MIMLRAGRVAIAFVVLCSGTVRAQCTDETEQGRRLVMEFATTYGTSGSRPTSVPVVDASQVRLLTNAADASVCQQLFYGWMGQRQDPDTAPTDRRWTYYQVGDLYYVVITRVSPPVQQNPDGTLRIRLGWTPILVFDRNFQHVVTVGR